MTKNINAYALAKGYDIIRIPVRVALPFFGMVALPTWLTYQTEYAKPTKRCIYTVFGMAQKMQKWAQKKARKSINDRLPNQYN